MKQPRTENVLLTHGPLIPHRGTDHKIRHQRIHMVVQETSIYTLWEQGFSSFAVHEIT